LTVVERHLSQISRPPDNRLQSAIFRQCLASLRSGDLSRAELLCREVIGSGRGNAQLLHLLGVIVARRGRLEEAVGLFTRALEGAPDPAAVLLDRATALAQLKRREEALASCDRAVLLRPHFPEAWNRRGAVLVELGRFAEALPSFDRALADRPDYLEALANRGDAFRALGRAEEALANYTRCLALKPDHARVINARGLVFAGLGRYREVLDHHNRAIRLSPDDPEAHNARGVALSHLKQYAPALASLARALSLRPDYAEAFLNNAKALAAMGRHEEALDSYDRALAIDPTLVEALHGRGRVVGELGLPPQDALAAYERALAVEPGLAQALIGKGNVLSRLERYEEALACFDLALEAGIDVAEAQARRAELHNRLSVAEAHFFRAETLRVTERLSEAVADYDKAIALCPDYGAAWNGRGLALAELGEPADALDSYDRALALRVDYVAVHANRSAVLLTLGRAEEALAAADRALALDPGSASALNIRGNALRHLGHIAAALGSYERAVAAAPELAQSHFNRAVCRLLAGDFARGWDEYEWRRQLPGFEKGAPRPQQPLWLGDQDIAGRTILLYAEQGHGDTIQFSRYVPLVAEKGAAVVLGVQPLLNSLLASLPGVRQIVGPSDRSLPPDFRCPLLSLPLAFGTRLETIPATVPYLAAPAANLRRWQERLGPRRGPRVGIAWSGNRQHKSDRDRSLRLDELAPIAALGLPLYCLQREMRPSDLPDFAMFTNIEYYGDALRDFADTAALIAQLDLVVTVDTAVAHLAGAMGKPVWTLLPYSSDWRWLLDRDDSPWYPTMRLFRQPRPGDWGTVLDRVRRELAKLH